MRWAPTAVFSAVCVASGSLWLFPTGDQSGPLELCLLTAALLIAALVFWMRSRMRTGSKPKLALWNWNLILSGVGSICAPALLILLGRQQLSSLMAVATLASVPLVVEMTTGIAEQASGGEHHFGPSLTALSGTLLLLPIALPSSSEGWLGLTLYLTAAGLAGVSSVLCHREMARVPRGAAFVTIAVANAIFLAFCTGIWLTVGSQTPTFLELFTVGEFYSLTATTFSLIGVIYLLSCLPPQAIASRFIFAPLIAAVEAAILLRPTLSMRAVVGALLMLAGGVACFRQPSKPESLSSMSLS